MRTPMEYQLYAPSNRSDCRTGPPADAQFPSFRKWTSNFWQPNLTQLNTLTHTRTISNYQPLYQSESESESESQSVTHSVESGEESEESFSWAERSTRVRFENPTWTEWMARNRTRPAGEFVLYG